MCAEIKERAEGNIEFKFPGVKLKTGCLPALAGIMLLWAPIGVGSMADVSFIRLLSAFLNIGEVPRKDL